MNRALLLACCLLAAAFVTSTAPSSFAQSTAPTIETAVSERDVEVGRPFSVQLSAMVNVSDRVPARPTLAATPGIVVRAGPSVMPKTHVTLNGPNLIQQMGIVATWTLEATRPGKFRIGPPSVTWEGKRYTGSVVDIVAHAAGTLPRPKSRDPFDIFDIFGLPRLPGFFDDPSGSFAEPLLPPTDPALAMTSAPARSVFLHAMVDSNNVVLGEQVTLSIYEYFQTSAVRKTAIHEPSAPDFLQYPVLDPSDDPGLRHAEVGSSIWKARLLRKVALFPLRVGELSIGSMRVDYQGRSLRSEVVRESKPLKITVTDAPLAGRPVGFRSGDVGEFSLHANVEPRQVDAGGAVSVRIKVRGVGNLPSTLPTPSSKGVEWLDPEIKEDIDAVNGQLRGERVFAYVVRLREPGTLDLGEVRLPYYSPVRRRYDTTKAVLGHVVVRENPELTREKADVDRFAAVGEPRPTLGEVPSRGFLPTDHVLYWIALFATPLSVVFAGAGWSLLRNARRSLRSWRDSLDRQVRISLRDADMANQQGRTPDAAASVERAVHAMIEASTGVKSRAVLRADLHARLVDAGVPEFAANTTVEILEACESLRFDPLADRGDVDELLKRTRSLSGALTKTRKPRK